MIDDDSLSDFDGTARVTFPLPNLVLFPNVVQPLHIFEPRYRQMTADALAGDRLLAVVLLRPGWEDLYNGRPEIHEVACVGRIIADQLMPDGRYNLLVRGLRRANIEREMVSEKLYRIAHAQLLDEITPASAGELALLRERLEEFVVPRFRAKAEGVEQLKNLFHGSLSLGALCDVLSFALPFAAEDKQGLLEEIDVEDRVKRMIGLIEAHTASAVGERKYPPDFSQN